MANVGILLNTATLTNDPYWLARQLEKPGNDYLMVAESAYRIPVPWLCCFRPEDMCMINIPLLNDDDEGDEGEEGEEGQKEDAEQKIVQIALPCTTVKQAIANLIEARPLFEAITGDARLGSLYWQESLSFLQALPLPFLTANLIEIIFGNDRETYCPALLQAMRGDAGAIKALMELSFYNKDVKAYPPDVLAVVSNEHMREESRRNGLALSLSATFDWRLSVGSKEPPPMVINHERGAHDLSDIYSELLAFLQKRLPKAWIRIGLVQPEIPVARVKVLISPKTDSEMRALMQDQGFCKAIYGPFQQRLERSCQSHGYQWLGYVICSDESVDRRFKGDYSIYNDWISLPVSRPGDTRPRQMSTFDRLIIREVNGYQELFLVDDQLRLERSLCVDRISEEDAGDELPVFALIACVSDSDRGEWRVGIDVGDGVFMPCRKVLRDQTAAEQYSREILQLGQQVEIENNRRLEQKPPPLQRMVFGVFEIVFVAVLIILALWLKLK